MNPVRRTQTHKTFDRFWNTNQRGEREIDFFLKTIPKVIARINFVKVTLNTFKNYF